MAKTNDTQKVNKLVKAKDGFLLTFKILGIVFQSLFILYYIYLIVTHWETSTQLVVVYFLLLGLMIVTMIFGFIFDARKGDDRDTKKYKKKRKKVAGFFIDITKYTLKLVTLSVVAYELLTKGGTLWAVTLNVMGWIFFGIQMTFFIIICFIKLAIQLFTRRITRKKNVNVEE